MDEPQHLTSDATAMAQAVRSGGTSNQALLWHVLGTLGLDASVEGYGRLLSVRGPRWATS